MAEILQHRHLAATAGGGGKFEAGTTETFQGRFNPFHLVEQFFAAFGLGATGGAGPEPVDVGLLGTEFLLLAFKGGLARLPFKGLLLEVLAVVTQVAARDAPFRFNNLIAHPI